MKRFKKVLVSVDTRTDHDPLIDIAVNIARHDEALLTIVEVAAPFPWAVRMTLPDHEQLRRFMVEKKEQKLQKLAQVSLDQGVSVETRFLEGKTSVEIVRDVIRENHDLVLARTKGEGSAQSGFFGHTAHRLLRQCPCPVWLVSPDSTAAVKHVLACVDTSTDDPVDGDLNDKILESAISLSDRHGCPYSVLHAYQALDQTLLSAQLKSDDSAEFTKQYCEFRQRQFEAFLEKYNHSVQDENVHLVEGKSFDAIANFVRQQSVDLVVMGTVGRSGLSGMLIGNTAEQVLDRIECSVLAVKPQGFISPVCLTGQDSHDGATEDSAAITAHGPLHRWPELRQRLRTAGTGALWSILSAFPIAALMALTIGFPIPFSGIASGPRAVFPAMLAVAFIGVIGGGFVLLAALGAIGAALVPRYTPEANNQKRNVRITSIALTAVCCLALWVMSLPDPPGRLTDFFVTRLEVLVAIPSLLLCAGALLIGRYRPAALTRPLRWWAIAPAIVWSCYAFYEFVIYFAFYPTFYHNFGKYPAWAVLRLDRLWIWPTLGVILLGQIVAFAWTIDRARHVGRAATESNDCAKQSPDQA